MRSIVLHSYFLYNFTMTKYILIGGRQIKANNADLGRAIFGDKPRKSTF